MKASIGLRTRDASFTAGTRGPHGLLERPPGRCGRVFGALDVHFAPPLIQSRMALTSAAVSAALPGGICNSPSRRTAL